MIINIFLKESIEQIGMGGVYGLLSLSKILKDQLNKMTGPGAAGCQSLSVSTVITGKTKKKKTSSHLVVVPHIQFRFSSRRW
jgi:hypothetical protein